MCARAWVCESVSPWSVFARIQWNFVSEASTQQCVMGIVFRMVLFFSLDIVGWPKSYFYFYGHTVWQPFVTMCTFRQTTISMKYQKAKKHSHNSTHTCTCALTHITDTSSLDGIVTNHISIACMPRMDGKTWGFVVVAHSEHIIQCATIFPRMCTQKWLDTRGTEKDNNIYGKVVAMAIWC